MALTNKLTAIADAIRAKTGASGTLTLPQMAQAIADIPTGGDKSAAFAEYALSAQTEDFTLTLNANVPNYACYGQTHLTKVTINATNINANAFQNCTALVCVIAKDSKPMGTYVFAGCSALRYLDLRNTSALSNFMFNNCTNLTLIDLTGRTTAPSIGTNTFANTNASWVALVADAAAKTVFQSATNWSNLTSHIKTVAEFEQEIGTTYDAYYLQAFGQARNGVGA